MKRFDHTFLESYCNDYFDEFLSDSTLNLKSKSFQYQKLLDKKHKILEKCPKLVEILENDKNIKLTAEESKYVREYEIVMIDIAILEEKEMFLKGMQEAYFLFKKINIIK